MSKPVALTIAGSDPTGGAGIQADLKTFAAHNVYGASAITALTAQNARRFEVFPVLADFITAQIDSVFDEMSVQAIKIGMLGNSEAVQAVVAALQRRNGEGRIPVIVDPVLRASNGGRALDDKGRELLLYDLLPLATLVKPNIAEAARLLSEEEVTSVGQMRDQAARLAHVAKCAVLLSGGHLAGAAAVDILCMGSNTTTFSAKKLEIPDLHGTGCALTSSIAAGLANGHTLIDAVEQARDWLAGIMAQEVEEAGGRYMDHLAPVDRKDANE